jgi:hypothetical protein
LGFFYQHAETPEQQQLVLKRFRQTPASRESPRKYLQLDESGVSEKFPWNWNTVGCQNWICQISLGQGTYGISSKPSEVSHLKKNILEEDTWEHSVEDRLWLGWRT